MKGKKEHEQSKTQTQIFLTLLSHFT